MPHALSVAPSRRLFPFGVLAAALLTGGCVEQTVQGKQIVFHFAWWLGPAAVAAGCLLIWIARMIRPEPRRTGSFLWGRRRPLAGMKIGLWIVAILLFVMAPASYGSRLLVDDDRFELRHGLIVAVVHEYRFRDFESIRYVTIRTERGKSKHELQLRTRAGTQETLSGDFLLEKAVPEILERARVQGVTALDESR